MYSVRKKMNNNNQYGKSQKKNIKCYKSAEYYKIIRINGIADLVELRIEY